MDNSVITIYLEQVLSNDDGQITHKRLAQLWMGKYGSNYRCSSLEYHKWYEHKNGVWIPIANDRHMPILIRSTLRHAFGEYLFYLCHSIMDSSNKRLVSKYISLVSKLITKLDGEQFINNILKECAQFSYNKAMEAFNIPTAKL